VRQRCRCGLVRDVEDTPGQPTPSRYVCEECEGRRWRLGASGDYWRVPDDMPEGSATPTPARKARAPRKSVAPRKSRARGK
jgi:hypothetical protein